MAFSTNTQLSGGRRPPMPPPKDGNGVWIWTNNTWKWRIIGPPIVEDAAEAAPAKVGIPSWIFLAGGGLLIFWLLKGK